MKSKISIILLISFITLITSNELLENKYYFLVSPSDKKNTPNIFYFYNLNEDMYTINSTELENMKIIGKAKSQENPIKNLSSVLKYEDKLLIKTCFAPKKIIEIIDENNEIFKPTDDYFKNIKNNLDNIKYCYSTIMMNPTNTLEEHIGLNSPFRQVKKFIIINILFFTRIKKLLVKYIPYSQVKTIFMHKVALI